MKGKTNQNLDDLKKLENLIGQKMFGKMARCFAGKELYFPKILLIAEKHQAIRNEYRKGMTVNTLTAKYGYTGTHIRQIVQNEEGKPERMTLQQGVKKLLKVFKKVM